LSSLRKIKGTLPANLSRNFSKHSYGESFPPFRIRTSVENDELHLCGREGDTSFMNTATGGWDFNFEEVRPSKKPGRDYARWSPSG